MKIYFQKGKRAGESFDFAPPGIFIGRENDNDLQLLSEGVSQYHAKIMHENEKWVIYDLGSRNGTKINGGKIKKGTILKSGDMIYIAKEALKIDFEEKAVDILDKVRDKTIKLRGPEEAKQPPPPIETPKYQNNNKSDKKQIPKKSREQKAMEREHQRLLTEAIKTKKKNLTIISIIIALIANGILFWWWFSNWLQKNS